MELPGLFDEWLANLAGNLVLPIFDAGKRRSRVDLVKAMAEEQLVSYRRVVYEAIFDVESALVRGVEQEQHISGVQRQVTAARKALNEAANRYRNGLTDYLPVLTQLLTVQRLERDLIQQQTEQFQIRIRLCRSLGGTWMDHVTVAPLTQAHSGDKT